MKKNDYRVSVNITVMVLLVLGIVLLTASGISAAPLRIGIAQIVAHPALDDCRDGFIAGMEKAGYVTGSDVVYDLQDAQGEMSNAIAIAQKYKDDKADLIVAIATPIAQAAAQVTSDIPIIIGAITDPIEANIAKSWESSGNNVTGMSDAAPNKTQIELIRRFLPEAKRVGTIYNAGEANSVVQIEEARKVCKELGLELAEVTASNSNEVITAAQSLAGRCDVFYIVTDNVAVSALSSIIKVSLDEKIPVVVADPPSVLNGALTSYGIDYYSLGERCAQKAIEVLDGKSPSEVPIGKLEQSEDLTFIINMDNANELDLSIPQDLLKEADSIVLAGTVWNRDK